MYRDQKPSKSIVTTEVRQRKTVITLDVAEIHEILQDWALRKVYADPAGTLDRIEVEFNVTPTTDENYVLDATCTVTEDLPIILPTLDEAPTNPNAFRLSHHLPTCICGACLHRRAIQPVPQTDGYAGLGIRMGTTTPRCSLEIVNPGFVGLPISTDHPQLNTTATSSRENVDAIERMKKEQPALLWMEDIMERVNKIHNVLQHGKGNNIVLNKGEVDTLLEYINVGALALNLDKVQRAVNAA